MASNKDQTPDNPKSGCARPKYLYEVLGLILGFVIIHVPLFSETYRGDAIDAVKAGQYGDFVGGYFGTFAALAASILLLSTLIRQQAQFKDDGFEKRFFQLLDYHRQNVAEFSLGDRSSRAIFLSMVSEFRLSLDAAKKSYQQNNHNLEPVQRFGLSYMGFYYGVGQNSSRILRTALKNYPEHIVNGYITMLEELNADGAKRTLLGYTPFEGHQSRLGHYFRHLYQIVKYIHGHAGRRANEFASMLRAQLSNHEQAILCANCLSAIGEPWRRETLVQRYELLKSLPVDFYDPASELDLAKVFPEINFEGKQSPEPNREVIT